MSLVIGTNGCIRKEGAGAVSSPAGVLRVNRDRWYQVHSVSLLLGAAALSFLFVSCRTGGRQEKIVVPQAVRSEREKFRTDLVHKTILGNLSVDPSKENESRWESAFWAIGLSGHTSEPVARSFHRAFEVFDRRSPSFQRGLLEATYAVYPYQYIAEMTRVLQRTTDERLFAVSLLYLLRVHRIPGSRVITELMERRFPEWSTRPVLLMLLADVQQRSTPQPLRTPPMEDLLGYPLPVETQVLYSIQRRDRKYPGIAVLRSFDGRFLRKDDGTFFFISQLALSNSNLPGYITNGNTPQGILSMQGFAPAANPFIGPTPTVQLVLPFEAPPHVYLHQSADGDTAWATSLYAQLLPESWRSYLSIFEAYYAGQAGRTEIIAHGTTIDPGFYSGQPYFPNTPSLGCLTASELWSEETGENIRSDQQKLVEAMQENGFGKGYCVVVELNDERRPVTLEDVAPLLTAAEARFQQFSRPAPPPQQKTQSRRIFSSVLEEYLSRPCRSISAGV